MIFELTIALYFSQLISGLITEKWKKKYDYVIVGGGTAGCVLANRLSQDPDVSVLVLEAGGVPDDPFISVPITWTSISKNPELDWGFVTEEQQHLGSAKGIFWSQAKMLGGSSSHNVMASIRGSPADYNGWHEMGNEGWSFKDVLPYFKKFEHILDDSLGNSGFRGTDGPFKIKVGDTNPMTEEFMKGAVELGYDELPDYNGPSMNGFGRIQYSVDEKGRRVSTYEAFLKPVLSRWNLDVVINAHVEKINIKKTRGKNKANGVTFSHKGTTYYVKAKTEVILSAGPMNSPKILMLSGIGHKDHLETMGIDVIADLPVGDNLQDHPVAFFPIFFSENSPIPRPPVFTFEALFEYIFTGKGPWSVPMSNVVTFHKTTTQVPENLSPYMEHLYMTPILSLDPDLEKSIRNGSGIVHKLVRDLQDLDKAPRFILNGIVHLHTRTRGTVRLMAIDPKKNPIINHPYLDNEEDMIDYIESIRRTQKLINSTVLQNAGVQPLTCLHPQCSTISFDTDDYWKCCVRFELSTIFHYAGTCKMANDKTGVVDDKLRVKGVRSLRVVDSSIIPVLPSAHTTLPTVMIAEKGSDMIINSH